MPNLIANIKKGTAMKADVEKDSCVLADSEDVVGWNKVSLENLKSFALG